MDSANSSSQAQLGSYRVRDPKLLLIKVLTLIFLVGISYVATLEYIGYVAKSSGDYYLKQSDFGGYAFVAYAALMSITAILLLRLRAVWSGVKIDLNERSIHIPGGNVSPNNFIDFFKPSFLFQHFLRIHIDMNKVRQISQQTKVTRIRTNIGILTNSGGLKNRYRYLLGLRGNFGAANVWFVDEGKRDEIYAAIRELNSMGDPFLKV